MHYGESLWQGESNGGAGHWYDVCLPNLAPIVETMKLGHAVKTPAQWAGFARKHRSEMATPDGSPALDARAAAPNLQR